LLDIRDDGNHTLFAGHILKDNVDLETDVGTENTTSSFTLSDGTSANDAYNGMQILVRDESATNREIERRRITDWTSGLVVTVDRAFSFTPTPGDHVHIGGYANVNVGSEDNIDFGAAKKTSLNAATTDLTAITGDKASYMSDVSGIISTLGTNGDGLTAIDLPNQTMDISGSLSGSVGSVSADVTTDAASRTASKATSVDLENDAITAAKVNVDAWQELIEQMFFYDATYEYNQESGSVVDQIVDNATSTGGDATEANQTILIASLTSAKGSGFVESTDSQEAIRNRGDTSWLTGAGSTPSDMYTDITTTPWQEVYHLIGDTDTEYYRDNLYTANGTPITSANLKIGKRVRE